MAYSRIKCPKCGCGFGQEARFLDHLTDDHGIGDYESLYVDVVLGGEHPKCGCGCNTPLKWSGWKKGYTSKYVRGHNAAVDSIYLNVDRQREFAEKRSKGYSEGKYAVWNKGLTKDDSLAVATAALKISKTLNDRYADGSITDWHQLDQQKAKTAAAKMSVTKREQFASGKLVSWNKGLTKKTSPIIMQISRRISEVMTSDVDASAKRFKLQDLRDLIDPLTTGNFQLLTDLSTYRNRHQTLQLKCEACGSLQEKNLMMLLATPTCFVCYPKTKDSKGQLELYEYVKLLAPDAVLDNNTVLGDRKEIDVWVPSARLGIEYNGLYWHGDKVHKQPETHVDEKRLRALAAGAKLLVVFEDEWKLRRSIIESMIESRLGKTTNKIGARECQLKELNPNDRRNFFEASHIDGDVKSTNSWGLWYDGVLVAALSVRRPFHKKYGDMFEVGRFASAPFTSVPGALGRLSAAAVDFAKTLGKVGLMSYVDLRLGDGHSYEAVGFKQVSETKPRFWWVINGHRVNRFAIKADSAKGVTQEQAARDAKAHMIWGCRNRLYTMPFSTPV